MVVAPTASAATFFFSGEVVDFMVPSTGTYRITAFGAQSGSSGAGPGLALGASGAESRGDFELTSDDKLEIAVGGSGGSSLEGGGGGSFVIALVNNHPLVIAGGGGGAGAGASYPGQAGSSGQTSTVGSNGYGLVGKRGKGGSGGGGGQYGSDSGAAAAAY